MNVELVNRLIDEKQELIAYMKVKILAQDWHAVCDSANDIREIEAKLEILRIMRDQNEPSLENSKYGK